MKKKVVDTFSPEAKRLSASLAVAILDLAIESGATYQEIIDACGKVVAWLPTQTRPAYVPVGLALREVGIFENGNPFDKGTKTLDGENTGDERSKNRKPKVFR